MANRLFFAKLTFALAAVTLAGCASVKPASTSTAPSATGTLPTAQAARISDEAIAADMRSIESLQRRLMELNKTGVTVKSYNFAKAQCWLDTAKTQYHENDRTGYIEEAMEQSIGLIQTIEKNRNAAPTTNTPLIAGSDLLRTDLWDRLNAAKARPGFECAAQTIACAEVRLVRAGHANEQTGWRQANPHIGMVEDALKLAERQAATCTTPSIVSVPANPAPGVTPTAAPQPVGGPGLERFVLLSDTLFKFDKSDMGNMLPGGRIRLNAVVKQLKQYQLIERIEVSGYTDRLGSDDYNATLSGARAATVRDFLLAQGIRATSATAVGKGKSNAMSSACSERASRAEQIACLQPDRRVEIEVFGVVKR